jgi:hypothetical protein
MQLRGRRASTGHSIKGKHLHSVQTLVGLPGEEGLAGAVPMRLPRLQVQ